MRDPAGFEMNTRRLSSGAISPSAKDQDPRPKILQEGADQGQRKQQQQLLQKQTTKKDRRSSSPFGLTPPNKSYFSDPLTDCSDKTFVRTHGRYTFSSGTFALFPARFPADVCSCDLWQLCSPRASLGAVPEDSFRLSLLFCSSRRRCTPACFVLFLVLAFSVCSAKCATATCTSYESPVCACVCMRDLKMDEWGVGERGRAWASVEQASLRSQESHIGPAQRTNGCTERKHTQKCSSLAAQRPKAESVERSASVSVGRVGWLSRTRVGRMQGRSNLSLGN